MAKVRRKVRGVREEDVEIVGFVMAIAKRYSGRGA
jgi:hypothetical protein